VTIKLRGANFFALVVTFGYNPPPPPPPPTHILYILTSKEIMNLSLPSIFIFLLSMRQVGLCLHSWQGIGDGAEKKTQKNAYLLIFVKWVALTE
jgi:hypothetical protein